MTRGFHQLKLKTRQVVDLVGDEEVVGWGDNDISHVIVAGLTREIVQWGVEPAGLLFRDVDRWLTKGLPNQINAHDVVVVGVGQEDGSHRLVQLLDGLDDGWTIAAWIDDQDGLVIAENVGIFPCDRVDDFLNFHSPSLAKKGLDGKT